MGCYIPVIGLEIHTQLSLGIKMFSGQVFRYGAPPNSLVNVVDLAHPGTLPTINRDAIGCAIKLGLACESKITKDNYFARKNYFYPDLPKGYQITQDKTPICLGGRIWYGDKCVKLARVHIEEDAGRLVHDVSPNEICIDFNRAGVALLEIVTAPEFRSSDDVYSFLHELRRIVRYLGICDGNMENGSLRCDANVSVMLDGSDKYGQRVEIKNMNSMMNVKLAVEGEISRQVQLLTNGGVVDAETRSYDAKTNKTKHMRVKETSDDYRYFVEPDLPCIVVDDEWIESIRSSMSLLPGVYRKKLVEQYKLSEYNASILVEDKDVLDFFEEVCKKVSDYTTVANWILGPIRGKMNELKLSINELPITYIHVVDMINAVSCGTINYSVATQEVLTYLLQNSNCSVEEAIGILDVAQDYDSVLVSDIVDGVLNKYKDKVNEYKNGKKGILGLFTGEVMRACSGKVDPKLVNNIIIKKLEGC